MSVVNRAGSWQGSAAIAKAKAYTANAFSTDTQAISTARLYTMAQPGHSLFGAGAANPFDPACLGTPKDSVDAGKGKVCGGTIVFGGGVPLYKGKTRVGGLGASGDTSCADHEIAKRIRSARTRGGTARRSATRPSRPTTDWRREMMTAIWMALVAAAALGFVAGVAAGSAIGLAPAPASAGVPQSRISAAARALWVALPAAVVALVATWTTARFR